MSATMEPLYDAVLYVWHVHLKELLIALRETIDLWVRLDILLQNFFIAERDVVLDDVANYDASDFANPRDFVFAQR